ncbi:nephrin-like [Ylistrum balloti]|uniref:nephrin-like n=1 Tax=Ylistrum balloti TaxID=509963 RepID=UPI002905C7FE|nr:nephrin-like [Ylistrum balloti]
MGVYQLKQAKSYIKEHLAEDGQYELMLCREKPDLIKVQVRSQHVASKVYNLWIEYSNGLTPISGWYCQYPLAARSIWMSPSGTITVISGTSQSLECQVKGGNPLVTLTWRCKGSEVVGVNLSKDSLSASRLIVPVDQTYNGKECVCTATNSTTTIGEKTVVFDVIYAPTDKLMMSPSGNKDIGAGDSVTLDCHVRGGNPIATLTWRCKGALRTGKNLTSTDTARSTLTVTVDKTYNGHMCACIATQQTNPGREIGRKTVEFNVIYAPTDKLMMSPSGNKDIGAGDSVTLDCHVRGGNPIATLTWRCKGALRTGKNMTSTDTARSTLTVRVDKTYNGHMCACIATQQTNPGREIGRKTVEFNVIYAPLATNIYLLPSGTETVTNGTTQRLECQLKGGNPLATLTWRCKESPRIGVNLTTSNLSASRLTFTVDETYHGQQCVCTATYSKTTIGTKTVVFNVLYAPVINLNTSKVILSEDSPSAPTQVFADCKGFGSAEVSWLAGDNGGHTQSFQVLYQTDGNVYKYPDIVTENDSDDYVLTVENLAEQSLYIFTILAFNNVGNVTSTDLGKCTVHGEVSPNKQTAIFSASVAMLCIGILALLLTIGVIAIFVKRKDAIL